MAIMKWIKAGIVYLHDIVIGDRFIKGALDKYNLDLICIMN